MKKTTRHHHHVGTSQSNLREKPYGFCCDVKDPKVDIQHGMDSLFSRHNLTEGGPNIKFRCQDIETLSTSAQRVNQRSLYRLGSRGRQRGRQRGGYDDSRTSILRSSSGIDRGNVRGGRGNVRGGRGNVRGGRGNGRGNGRGGGGGGGNEDNMVEREQIICKRCRGPLRWYLEDEIDAARDIMMNNRRINHNKEMEDNIAVAKKKEKKKKK
ncbi:uncharacterized protein LOC143217725 [Lasioglossum baleicum]|uniref:uncharacterized protein LOC143217725 n=1 Tax=Lasioglossum baleicum TaxID=434251 RepID=UPI003FCDB56E